ncbi:chaoptin, partial [Frankliniella occidentalis]|uniref:Chaoptin n=1 Tax=Frankliniella occidentalis TaxID=133901 RepID=A0A9C6XCK0_FRAOC
NQVGSLTGNWTGLRDSLRSLYLGENDLLELPPGPGGLLADSRRLSALDLDRNKLAELNAGALPASLHTLSAAHNLIHEFPAKLVQQLPNLGVLSLRGNVIESLPATGFHSKRTLDRLDLGDNHLQVLPGVFNGSLQVRDLHLDLNYLKTLPAQALRGCNTVRLFLGNNRLETLDERAFVGVGHTLEYLDLEGNRLGVFPHALKHLKRLRYLYLGQNGLRSLANDSLHAFANTMRALSLTGNRLEEVPAAALRSLRKLSHLNIGYNRIAELSEEDLADWAASLDTLLLPNNLLTELGPYTFRQAPRLRELSISFNKLRHVDPLAFAGLGDSLLSLEASFCLYDDHFPEDMLQPLASLSWLSLDNNNIRLVNGTALYRLPKLQYLNLESNFLTQLPAGLFHASIHASLGEVRLGYNNIASLHAETFSGLTGLQTVVLTGNRIRSVAGRAFVDLSSLVNILLGGNMLSSVDARAFVNLPALNNLDLHGNRLTMFSMSAFLNVTSDRTPLTLNLSSNHIVDLFEGETGVPLHLQVLDVSHNQLAEVPVNFLMRVSTTLSRLYLGHNRITKLDGHAFGSLPAIELIGLENNEISAVAPGAFDGYRRLQIVSLAGNQILHLQPDQFARLPALRIVDLSDNHVRSLPRSALSGTRVEHLDLSGNEFVVVPSSALEEVGDTLRLLDMSRNIIEHLDSTMFPGIPWLTTLNLSRNRLTFLPDNVFSSLAGLLDLDLSRNTLRANFGELFHYVQQLRRLSLAETGLHAAPALPLPHLLHLNLSGNAIRSLPSPQDGLQRLRVLVLSNNDLQHLPAGPMLRELDISGNPIKVLTRESFAGLPRLQSLTAVDLPRLERFDSDSLSRLRALTSLSTQTWPRIEKYRFRLGNTLSAVPSLRRLSVRVLERSLTDQLLGAFNPKLRRIELTGPDLQVAAGDAFEGIEDHQELALQIRGTQLSEFPPGLFSRLERVAHLSLDIRDNQFTSLSADTFYHNSSWETVGTKLIPGGLNLNGNPWSCDCALAWLGGWLRRWLREVLQVHAVAADAAQQLQDAARQASCVDPRSGHRVPLLRMRDPGCQASALSSAASWRWRPPSPAALGALVTAVVLATGSVGRLGASGALALVAAASSPR